MGLFLVITGVGRISVGALVVPMRGWFWLCAVGIAASSLGIAVLVLSEGLPASVLVASVGLALLLVGMRTLEIGRLARRYGPAGLMP